MVEVAELGAAQLVRRAVLVNEPGDLAVVAREIRRELRADDQVDRPAVALAEVEQPPCGGVGEDLVFRIPLERQRDALHGVPAGPELRDEAADVQLGASLHERHLRLADHDRADVHEARGPWSDYVA